MARGQNAFAIAEVLDKLERGTREAAKSLDGMRDELSYDRLRRARETIREALEALDKIIDAAAGKS